MRSGLASPRSMVILMEGSGIVSTIEINVVDISSLPIREISASHSDPTQLKSRTLLPTSIRKTFLICRAIEPLSGIIWRVASMSGT